VAEFKLTVRARTSFDFTTPNFGDYTASVVNNFHGALSVSGAIGAARVAGGQRIEQGSVDPADPFAKIGVISRSPVRFSAVDDGTA
jgi:hypothetical protein